MPYHVLTNDVGLKERSDEKFIIKYSKKIQSYKKRKVSAQKGKFINVWINQEESLKFLIDMFRLQKKNEVVSWYTVVAVPSSTLREERQWMRYTNLTRFLLLFENQEVNISRHV